MRITFTRHALKERIPVPGRSHEWTDGAELMPELQARYVAYDATPAGRTAKIRLDVEPSPEILEAINIGDLPSTGERIKASYSNVNWDKKNTLRRNGSSIERRAYVSSSLTAWEPDAFDEDGDDRPTIMSAFPCTCGGLPGQHHIDGCQREKTLLRDRAERQRIRKGEEIIFSADVVVRFKMRVSGVTETVAWEQLSALAKEASKPELRAQLYDLIDKGIDVSVIPTNRLVRITPRAAS